MASAMLYFYIMDGKEILIYQCQELEGCDLKQCDKGSWQTYIDNLLSIFIARLLIGFLTITYLKKSIIF